MKIILLSGGAGKRLWPLSSELLPKQFMKIWKDGPDESISMLQRTWRHLTKRYGLDSVYITASASHETVLREQLGSEAHLILEPDSRDTFPAIALACSYLSTLEDADADESIVVLPVDAFVQPDFYDILQPLDRAIQQQDAPIVLVGIRPKHASEKYGYVMPRTQDHVKGMYLVDQFIEKPPAETAAKLVDAGALWNGGIFAFNLSYICNFMQRSAYPWQYSELLSHYQSLPRISFDYMVVEPEKHIGCFIYDGEWTDLGTWTDLVRTLHPDQNNLVITDDTCMNTFVINQLKIPIIVAGISNAVIAVSPDGILIVDQRISHTIKPLLARLPGTI